jgi:hypothetical protein
MAGDGMDRLRLCKKIQNLAIKFLLCRNNLKIRFYHSLGLIYRNDFRRIRLIRCRDSSRRLQEIPLRRIDSVQRDGIVSGHI